MTDITHCWMLLLCLWMMLPSFECSPFSFMSYILVKWKTIALFHLIDGAFGYCCHTVLCKLPQQNLPQFHRWCVCDGVILWHHNSYHCLSPKEISASLYRQRLLNEVTLKAYGSAKDSTIKTNAFFDSHAQWLEHNIVLYCGYEPLSFVKHLKLKCVKGFASAITRCTETLFATIFTIGKELFVVA